MNDELLEKVRDDFTGKSESIVATGYQMFQEHVDNSRGRITTQTLSICDTPDYYIAKAGHETAIEQMAAARLSTIAELEALLDEARINAESMIHNMQELSERHGGTGFCTKDEEIWLTKLKKRKESEQ